MALEPEAGGCRLQMDIFESLLLDIRANFHQPPYLFSSPTPLPQLNVPEPTKKLIRLSQNIFKGLFFIFYLHLRICVYFVARLCCILSIHSNIVLISRLIQKLIFLSRL